MKRSGDLTGTRKKRFLTAAGLVLIAVPALLILSGAQSGRAQSHQQNAADTPTAFAYDVVSVKPVKPAGGGRGGQGGGCGGLLFGEQPPDGFIATNVALNPLIEMAFGVEPWFLRGQPSWLYSECYDISAKMDGSVVEALQKLSPAGRILARQHMIQVLLADRFKLTIKHEIREVPVSNLIIAKNGPKLQDAKPGFILPNGTKAADGASGVWEMFDRDGKSALFGVAVPISKLAEYLTNESADPTDHPVVDKTGLTGTYDFTVRFTSDDIEAASPSGGAPNGMPPRRDRSSERPAMLAAIEKQLGLKLQSGKGPVNVIVIDHVERPSGN